MKLTPSIVRSFCLTLLLGLGINSSIQAQLGRQQGLIDPNIASEKDLLTLPHMNQDLVKSIISQRPFSTMAEFNGLLKKSLSKEQTVEVYRKSFIHIDLNKASRDEMLLIPGLGNRMLHEFEEYRPYKSIAQFRKEMSKYVSATEVARLEQYVFVPIPLNTATDEDLLTIPGLGMRMLREFKEYRPYKNFEQFRKEIGKYVGAKEVARLERYLTIQ